MLSPHPLTSCRQELVDSKQDQVKCMQWDPITHIQQAEADSQTHLCNITYAQ